MVYMGEVYQGMLDLYLDAMSVLLDRSPELVPRLNLFGTIDEAESRRIAERGLSGHIRYRGFVSMSQSIRIVRESPSLLLLLPHEERCRTWIPSKLYPYLFSDRPILALVPAGDAADIITRAGAGVVVQSTDPDEVARRIGEFVGTIRTGAPVARRDEEYISRYSVSRLAERVDALLEPQGSE
jgi:hypothetical protein